jgi:hypothetical protein
MKTAITHRPLEEWSHDELIMLEDQLWGGWIVDEIDFDAIRTRRLHRRVRSVTDYGTWLEHFVTEVDRVLTAAGYPKIRDTRLDGG